MWLPNEYVPPWIDYTNVKFVQILRMILLKLGLLFPPQWCSQYTKTVRASKRR